MSRIYLITGTSRGIGKALCELYLDEGNIVIGVSRSESQISHKNYTHFSLDTSDENAVIAMIRAVKKEFKRVDVLINSVGIARLNHILTTDIKSVEDIFRVNFNSTFLFTREVGKMMAKAKGGKIVNFSTIAVALSLAGEAIYAASKGAIQTFTKVSAKELGEFGINVNLLGISPIKTDLIKTLPQKKLDELLEKQILKELCCIADIKNAVDFFCDEKSRFITGQTIYLGGVW